MARIEAGQLTELLAPGDVENAGSAVKGAALEGALRYAFEQIPGIRCEMERAKNASASEEIDLFFSNVRNEDGLRRFESELLVEAKNWSDPVGAIEINWFATKLRRRNQRIGVLVAANGTTGDPGLMNAAVAQIGHALGEGQEVVILERWELEAVSSGERLAKLLEQKRDHLVGRQDIFIADPATLRRPRGTIRLGSEAFGAVMRGERTKLIEEAQQLDLGPDNGEQALVELKNSLEKVEQAVTEWNGATDQDPRGLAVRAALMDSAGWCMAWLDLLDFSEPNTIWFNASRSGLDQVRPHAGTRLWLILTDYYLSELEDQIESHREPVLFALVAMLIEEINSLDDYRPEEFD